jgi:hypothetical protein
MTMILVRDVFRLKFGKARDAQAAFKDLSAKARTSTGAKSMRMLADLVGPYYTMVFESTYDNLSSYEKFSQQGMSDPEWRTAYQKFVPLVDSGYREIFTVVEEM